MLQAKISQRMATLNLPGIAKAPVLDKEGRTLDASGKAISVIKHEPTLKVRERTFCVLNRFVRFKSDTC